MSTTYCPFSGKPGHATKAGAIAGLRHTLRRGNLRGRKKGGHLQVYRCADCGQWHVGSNLRKEGRSR